MKTKLTIAYRLEPLPDAGNAAVDTISASTAVRVWLENNQWLGFAHEGGVWRRDVVHKEHVHLSLLVQELVERMSDCAHPFGCTVRLDVDCEGDGQLLVGPSGKPGIVSHAMVQAIVDKVLDDLDLSTPERWDLAAKAVILFSIQALAAEFDDEAEAGRFAANMLVELDGKRPQLIALLRQRWLERKQQAPQASPN